MKRIVAVACGIALLGAGCGGTAARACEGTVVDKFTEYSPGVVANGVLLGAGTKYRLALEASDGDVCDRGVKKKVWLQVKLGSHYPPRS